MEPPGPPNSVLDPYRRGVCRVFENGVEVGVLWTRVRVWWVVVGHLWWQRGIRPSERPEWFLDFHGSPDWTSETWQDRVPSDDRESDEMIEEFERGAIQVNGHTFTLEWLSESDASARRAPGDYWTD